jgi:hypothetical protein
MSPLNTVAESQINPTRVIVLERDRARETAGVEMREEERARERAGI